MARYDPLTLAGVIEQMAAEKPDCLVLTIEGAGVRADETRTYAQLWDRGQRLAAGLQSLNLQPGEKLGTLLANHVELVDLMLACSLLGAVLVPIDPRTRAEKLTYMLDAADCRGVVAGDYALQEVLNVREKVPGLRWVMGLRTDELAEGPTLFDRPVVLDFQDAAHAKVSATPLPGCAPDDALELIYTSGTTGDPKGIVLTHRRYVETAKLLPRMFGLQPDERLYSGLSLTHANAQVITLGTALVHALPCVLSRRFSKSRLWDITRKYRCTNFTLLGGMTTAIYAEAPKPDDADNPVRTIISAGMPAAIWSDFASRFGVQLYEFYGAAEGGLTGNPPGVGPIGSIGKPILSLDYRIVDDDGHDVVANARGERIGELLFRPKDGTPFKVEYHRNPEASAKKCAGGWLHMGDVVRADSQGWLYFLFRKGGGIRRNGDFIDPAQIEKTIAEDPAVDDVYVYGIPAANGVAGEKDVVAAVVPKSGGATPFDPQSVFQLCRRKLGPHLVPSHVQVLAQIPKTASEKPQDRYLIEALQLQPETVYSQAH